MILIFSRSMKCPHFPNCTPVPPMNDTFKSICINNQISSNEYVTLIYSSYRIQTEPLDIECGGQWRTMKCFLYELVEDIWELTAEVPCCSVHASGQLSVSLSARCRVIPTTNGPVCLSACTCGAVNWSDRIPRTRRNRNSGAVHRGWWGIWGDND